MTQARSEPKIALRQLASIQAARGVAAFVVMVMHVCTSVAGVSRGVLWQHLSAISTSFGHAGVDVFFVICGTIMYLISTEGRSDGRLKDTYAFLVRRFFRIYPLFWVTLAFSICCTPAAGPSLLSFQFLETVSLYWSAAANPVSWTLPYEIRFYVIVAACILVCGRKMIDIGFLVAGVSLLALFGLSRASGVRFELFGMNLMTEFVFGLAVGALIQRKCNDGAGLSLVVATIGFLVSFSIVYAQGQAVVEPQRHILFGVPAALMLYSLISLERRGRFKPAWTLSRMGDWSYSIYLWHYPIMLLLFGRFFHHDVSPLRGLRYFVLTVTISLFVAVISFYAIERPSIRVGHRWSRIPYKPA